MLRLLQITQFGSSLFRMLIISVVSISLRNTFTLYNVLLRIMKIITLVIVGGLQVSNAHVCDLVDIKILWRGDPLRIMTTFQRRVCKLCMEEQLQILKARKKDPALVLKRGFALMDGYCHSPKFHRFHGSQYCPNTDEG